MFASVMKDEWVNLWKNSFVCSQVLHVLEKWHFQSDENMAPYVVFAYGYQ